MKGLLVTFEEYVQQKGPQLLRVAFLLTRDAHLAEDLVQSALLELYRKWSRVARARSMDGYVRRVLVNTYLDWTRRRSWGERPVDDERLLAADYGAEDPADVTVQAEQLRDLVHGLPPRARAVLVLRYYLELDDATIAEHMNVTPSTVRATAFRALAALRADAELLTTTEQP